MLSNNLKISINKLNKNISEKDLRYYLNPTDEVVSIYWNISIYECVYSGGKTMFRHLPSKAIYGYCSTPKVVKSFYTKIFDEMMLNKKKDKENDK